MQYAYAKLQGLNGESFYIQNLPTKLCRKVKGDTREESKFDLETIPISDSHGIALCHSLISYDEKIRSFFLIPFGGVYIDNKFYSGVESAGDVLDDFFAKPPRDIERHEDFKVRLNNYSKIYFPTDDTETPLVFYLILPKTGNSSFLKKDQETFLNPAKLPGTTNKLPDKITSLKWNADDREDLKKFLLMYGYGRWKKIQKASTRLKERPISELRSFSNAFIQCIVENLSVEESDLRKYMLSMIEDYPGDPYILANPKDWDASAVNQRAVPWAKRLQILQRVRFLMTKFKENQRKTQNIKSSKDMQWYNLLNFMSSVAFYGQRPSLMWTRKHDVDLLRGTYKFGFANYSTIKNHPEYTFNELDTASGYSDFPNADAFTRRLKKLNHQISKLEQKEEDVNFEEVTEEELKGWETEEKKRFFNFVLDFGIPLNNEGKANWLEMKERATKEFGNNKNINEIEKFVDKVRIRCKQMAENTFTLTEDDDLADLNLTNEDAQKFNKNNEMLFFIRRVILGNKMSLLIRHIDALKKETQEILPENPGTVPPEYDCAVHDKNMLVHVSENGLSSLEKLLENKENDFDQVNMTLEQLNQRLEYVYGFFVNCMAQTAAKKRKASKPIKDETQKKTKLAPLSKDDIGNITFPLQVTSLWVLLDPGKINPGSNYHSTHNLFPVGYKCIRTYDSMLEKGKKAQYTCEILEGTGGKPLFRVTSNEDPDNPIVRETSSGCWLYICTKVNELSETKKAKVTVSGTAMYGLTDPTICRILEHLDGAEKCTKYKFKYRAVEGMTEETE